MKKEYIAPKVNIVKIDLDDIIQTSGVVNVDTSEYGFTTDATYTNQGQKWLDIWDMSE